MNLKLELALRTVTTKVTPAAWDRAQRLKDKTGKRLSDIISVCLLFMPEDELIQILDEQDTMINAMPKAIRGFLRNADRLSEEERKMLMGILSDPE